MIKTPATFIELIDTVSRIVNESRRQLARLESARQLDAELIASKRAELQKIQAELRLITSSPMAGECLPQN